MIRRPSASALGLTLLWAGLVLHDQLWLGLHVGVPDWDEGKYLSAALNIWRALRESAWFDAEWRQAFWQLAPKSPPMAAIVTAPLFEWLGPGMRQAVSSQSVWLALLMAATYRLGAMLFNRHTAAWASALVALLPAVGQARLRYTLDFPVMTAATVALLSIASWRLAVRRSPASRGAWLRAAAAGAVVGWALLVKLQAIYFVAAPVIAIGLMSVRARAWRVTAQATLVCMVAAAVIWPWFAASWVLILSGGWRATAVAAGVEAQPAWLSWAGWTAYLRWWPRLVSWPVLIVAAAGVGWFWRRQRDGHAGDGHADARASAAWLTGIVVGSYVVATLSPNRQARYLLGAVPPFVLLVGWLTSLAAERWTRRMRAWAVVLVLVGTLFSLWPVGGRTGERVAAVVAPSNLWRPDLGPPWPHAAIVDHIVSVDPWLVSTVGVMVAHRDMNTENLDALGHVRGFQVYGREAGARASRVDRDARAFTWFVDARGPRHEANRPSRRMLADRVASDPRVAVSRVWPLRQGASVTLYRQRTPSVIVRQAPTAGRAVALARVEVPAQGQAGSVVPIDYVWHGSAASLSRALVLVTWTPELPSLPGARLWTHDHAIGFGQLYVRENAGFQGIEVHERTAMRLPSGLPAGRYRIGVALLDRRHPGAAPVAIGVPPTVIDVAPAGELATHDDRDGRDLDLVTQLRDLAAATRTGVPAIRRLFDELGRIDQYDPTQDFFEQAALSASWRLRDDPRDIDAACVVLLARALQRRIPDARTAAGVVMNLDPSNPYLPLLASVVELFDMRPQAGATLIDRALALGADEPEAHGLAALAAAMRLDVRRAWREARVLTRGGRLDRAS